MRSLWCLWCPFESSVNAECILPTLTKYFATFPSGNPKGLYHVYEHNGMMRAFFDSQIVSSCSDSNTILEPFILKRDRHVLAVATFWIHLGIMTGTAPSYFLCMASSWEKMFWEKLNLPQLILETLDLPKYLPIMNVNIYVMRSVKIRCCKHFEIWIKIVRQLIGLSYTVYGIELFDIIWFTRECHRDNLKRSGSSSLLA